jgi:hypothetical protein
MLNVYIMLKDRHLSFCLLKDSMFFFIIFELGVRMNVGITFVRRVHYEGELLGSASEVALLRTG